MDEAKNQNSNLEYKEPKNTQSEKQKEKRIPPNEDSVRSLWDNFKCANIHIMGFLEGKEREQQIEKIMREKGIELAALWFSGPHSVHRAIPARDYFCSLNGNC